MFASLATDIELFDQFPKTISYAKRQHRWIRGDWQIWNWAFWSRAFHPRATCATCCRV